MKRVLREYIRIARRHGLEPMGQDGRQHYIFGRNGKILVRAASTPNSVSTAVYNFESKCFAAANEQSPLLRRPVVVDGNAAFRELEDGKHEPSA